MIFQHAEWMGQLIEKLKKEFRDSLLLVGLQGSRRRQEATEQSDIDVVLILEQVGIPELDRYQRVLSAMPERDKICGFCCGRQELLNWPRYDLFQLYRDTEVYYGDFALLLPPLNREAAEEAVRIGASGLYHGACHGYLHNPQFSEALSGLYKMAFFILQGLCFLEKGKYLLKKQELLSHLEGEEREILELCIRRDEIPGFSPDQIKSSTDKLLHWCSEVMAHYPKS